MFVNKSLPKNVSSIINLLNYFPPPPPVLPGPPPRRLWTCSSHSSTSLSCFISDDRNPSSLRQYIASNVDQQSKILRNTSTSLIQTTSSSSKFNYLSWLTNFFHRYSLFLTIFFSICLLLLLIVIFSFVYFSRIRRRNPTTEKNRRKFYYSLLPHRQQTHEEKLVRLRSHESPSIQSTSQQQAEQTV